MLARRLLTTGSGGGPGGGGGSGFTAPEPSLYALINGQNGDGVYAIGAATKTATSVWSEHGSNPVLQKGTGWESHHVKDPWLIHDGTQYVCYYSGSSTVGGIYQIGRATATSHTGPWTKYGSNPIIALGSSGAFDDAGILFPTILYEPSDTGKEWKCWYGGYSGTEYSIGYAYSTNGTSWTKVGQVLTKGSAGTWEDEGVNPGAIYKSGSTYYLFYQGYQDPTVPKWQGGIATFTDPEGTYTKSASNPVLLARFNDSGVFQTPSANTNAGSAIVTMPSTAAFTVGESVVLADNNSETEVNEILRIDSATQITLTSAAVSSFTTAAGFAFRPLASVSVIPRTVRVAQAGGYEMFGTAFQPVEDLTVGGSKLREGSLRWTASSLTGPWSYDYTTGLMFALYPTNTGWDQLAAENPSVIVAP